ncbi:NAD(P)-dependent oxidoreductase [Novosphingobium sp.]|uniref:NAD(P)-dependent oxidoreductase n=1 Tax=Novosphingobium sp. TaxID=1874826 RepID=UPI002FD9993A
MMSITPEKGKVVLIGSDVVDVVALPVQVELAKRGIETAYLNAAADQGSLLDALRDADVLYCPGAFPVTPQHMDAARNLRAVVSIYTGTEGIDESAATARNIVVANGQITENTDSMAEAAILMMLAATYDLAGAERSMTAAGMHAPRRPARMLQNRTVGLIGFGAIGRAVAKRLEAWNIDLLISTPRPQPPYPYGAQVVSLETLLATADVTCLLAPLRPETQNLLNRERLAGTKQGSIFVNMSRGQLVDEQALFELARDRHFTAIALDVFVTEPLPADSPLRTLPNAILTPHALGHTLDSKEGLVTAGLENITRALAGVSPAHVRNPAILPSWEKRWSKAANE